MLETLLLYGGLVFDYKKLLINNISKTYKKLDSTIFNAINREAKNITKKYDIDERVGYFAKSKHSSLSKITKRISNQTQNAGWLVQPKVMLEKLVNSL